MFNLAVVTLSTFRRTAAVTAGVAQGLYIMTVAPRSLRQREIARVRAQKQITEITAQRNIAIAPSQPMQLVKVAEIDQVQDTDRTLYPELWETPQVKANPVEKIDHDLYPELWSEPTSTPATPMAIAPTSEPESAMVIELEQLRDVLKQVQEVCRDFGDRRKDSRNWVEANRLLKQLQVCFG